MKKKILIAVGIYILIFLLGGVYIVITTNHTTSELSNLVKLYQVETQRRQLLVRIKTVQLDLNLWWTPHMKGVETTIEDVRSMERSALSCFTCHHAPAVVRKLNRLIAGIDDYKEAISRVLTLRADHERVSVEGDKAFQVAEKLIKMMDSMIHSATTRLVDTTEVSLSGIRRSNLFLYFLVGLTPLFAAGLAFVFLRGFTHPVRTLVTATRKIESGDFDFRIEGLKDEFGDVATSFNEMAARVGESTHRLKDQTVQLEQSHTQLSTFCYVLKQIGSQETLNGLSTFLIKEVGNVLETPHVRLYVFSSDRDLLYVMSDTGVQSVSNPEQIQRTFKAIEKCEGSDPSAKMAIPSPLLPDTFPSKGRRFILPFRIQDFTQGALVGAFPAKEEISAAEEEEIEMQLQLVSLILEQAAGTIKSAIVHQEEIHTLEHRIENLSGYGGIIGKDPKMQAIYRLIEDIAPTDATVLIQGETGTGKEMVARAIYEQSDRKEKPFVVINCSAYPETLLESELFGHEKGAFTGAIRKKRGRFEQADGGTVFLDEIGEISPSAQIKLLRVLQTQRFERLGGTQAVEVDVRILSATNRDLLEDVKASHFREDLYYRLNVIPLRVPSLRSRRNDIPLLARHFQRKFTSEQGAEVQDFSSQAMRRLLEFHWPGNVRELENAVEHAVVLSRGGKIQVGHLPVGQVGDDAFSSAPMPVPSASLGSIAENEKRHLIDALMVCNWNKSKAALRLEISRSTLYDKLEKYQIEKPHSTAS